MTNFTDYGPTEIVDMPDIQSRSITWAKENAGLLPDYLTDIEASVIINGLRILEKVLLDNLQKSNHNKSLYLFPLNPVKRIDSLEQELKD